VEDAALGTLRIIRTRTLRTLTLRTLRTPNTKRDDMGTDVGAAGEDTCFKGIRDAPARLRYITRPCFDE
jgi:hypothetical protein